MSLEQKYVDLAVKYMNSSNVRGKTINGGRAYSFPCPFCSEVKTSSGKSKPTKRTAVLMPIKGCEGKYSFLCMRGDSAECREKSMELHKFLWLYKPYLAERLKTEKSNDNPTNFTFKPNF